MTRTVQEEENEHHANRHLQADPEGEAHKEERVRERTRMYEEQGVGIAAQQGAANDNAEAADDEDETDEEVGDDDVGDDDASEEDEEEN
jgi:hypothetical protein